MTTARECIYRSLRLLGVLDPEETPTGTMADNALTALNRMVHSWKGSSIDVGHDDWTLDDEVTLEIAPEFVGGMEALLATELLPEYPGTVLSPAVVRMADKGWNALQARYFDTSADSDLTAPLGLQRIGLSGRWW